MYAGWLDDITAWLWKVVKLFFDALTDFIGDLFVRTLEQIFSVILLVLEYIPLPEFMSQNSIGSMLANGGGTVLWFAEVFQIGPSMVLIGIAIVFYLLRRVLTIGIW
ncbi:phage coat protein [Stenotrophomonas rhizophila]|uniref:phage coat protein n=1 Tax=Stenotrophomonas rhizophila TaxID=216778 RepID=UPI001E473F24|nr:phage coat protein [Stenotrophomonas rhizophila]MCC7635362.1 phage coat protein [Stenotrophomonas rhizophila]MCC7664409.1 phage coat protein [Stenotrophomonas rhizophila]